jgi:hypothetical protein
MEELRYPRGKLRGALIRKRRQQQQSCGVVTGPDLGTGSGRAEHELACVQRPRRGIALVDRDPPGQDEPRFVDPCAAEVFDAGVRLENDLVDRFAFAVEHAAADQTAPEDATGARLGHPGVGGGGGNDHRASPGERGTSILAWKIWSPSSYASM